MVEAVPYQEYNKMPRARRELFVRQIWMMRLHVVLPRMKDQRLALPPPVVNHLTEKDDVIASVEFSNHAADELSGGAFQQRAALDAVAAVNFGETVRDLGRKPSGKMMLVRCENVNRKMPCFGEI
jgi:hypothetical protein